MASISGNGSRKHHSFTLNVNEDYVGSGSENFSYISYSFTISPIVKGYDWSGSSTTKFVYTINIGGNIFTGNIPKYDGKSTVTVSSGNGIRIDHNNDGTKNLDFSFTFVDGTSYTYTPGDASASGSMSLTTIPRYANLTRCDITGRTSHSLTVTWAADVACDTAQYSLDGGNNWSAAVAYPTFTIDSLASNTQYYVSMRLVRSDSKQPSEFINVTNQWTFPTTNPTISLSSKTNKAITVSVGCNVTVKSWKYRIKQGSGSYGNWQTSNTFGNLSGNTAYTIQVEAVANDSGEPGYAELPVTTYPNLTFSNVSCTGKTNNSITFKATPSVAIKSKSWTLKNSSGTTIATSTSTAESVTFSTNINPNTAYTCYVSGVSTDANGAIGSETYTASGTTYPNTTFTFSLSAKTDKTLTITAQPNVTLSSKSWQLKNSSGTTVKTSSSNTDSVTFSGLAPSTNYYVYVEGVSSSGSIKGNGTSSPYNTYASTTFNISCTEVTETSLTIKATPSSTLKSKSWTVKNPAGTVVKTSTSTAESVKFDGLSADTKYTILVSGVATLGDVVSDTYNVVYATHSYPYIESITTSSLTIGNKQIVKLHNPLKRSVTVYMRKDNTSGTLLYSGTTNVEGNFEFTPTAATLYNSIPNNTSGSAVYYCVYSNQTVKTQSGTYKIIGTEYPSFSTSNWSYDVTTTYNSLTGNDTKVVIGDYSTVKIKVNTSASSNYGASGYTYSMTWGNITGSTTTLNTDVSLVKGNGSTLVVKATDNRNLPKESTLTLSEGVTYIPYSSPSIYDINAPRLNGVDAETHLNVDGTYYRGKFGSNGFDNTLYSIEYYTKLTTSSTWNGPYTIPVNSTSVHISNGSFSIQNALIHANGSNNGFDVGKRYNVKVVIKDAKGLLGSVEASCVITDGKVARDVYQDHNGEYHEGINGRADSNYTEKINGTLCATGSIKSTQVGDSFVASHGTANQNSFFVSARTDTGVSCSFGVGSGGTNHGVWSTKLNKWLVYGDGSKVYFDGYNLSDACSKTVKNLTSKSHANYNSDNGKVPNIAFISYWNGAYDSGNNSNLTYCAQGTIIGSSNIGSQNVAGANTSKLLLTNPTSDTTYYPTFTSGISDNTYYSPRGNNGITYKTREGTTSQEGWGRLYLGNGTAKGAAGNKYGGILMYGNGGGSSYVWINASGIAANYNMNIAFDNLSANRTINIPNEGGTFQLKPTILYNGGGNGNITLSDTVANYKKIEICYGLSWGKMMKSDVIYNNGAANFAGLLNLKYCYKDGTGGAEFLKVLNISAKSITVWETTRMTSWDWYATQGSPMGGASASNGMYIQYVIGYK